MRTDVMKRTEKLTVRENLRLNPTVFKMVLSGTEASFEPGQFVEAAVEGLTLRRPISVADSTDGLTLIYKTVGVGTEKMSRLSVGDSLDVLLPLGNGFDREKAKKPLLIGGGIGIAPMLFLAKKFVADGIRPTLLLGAAKKEDMFLLDEFAALGELVVCTDNGSLGIRSNVTDVLKSNDIDFDYYYACGPAVMLAALKKLGRRGEISLEARMGCGFGACMGCTVLTKSGAKRVCADGPVFEAEEVIFND